MRKDLTDEWMSIYVSRQVYRVREHWGQHWQDLATDHDSRANLLLYESHASSDEMTIHASGLVEFKIWAFALAQIFGPDKNSLVL